MVEWLLTGTLLEMFVICPYPTSGHFVWGTLHLGMLQELIHQGRMLRKGACQLYDLSTMQRNRVKIPSVQSSIQKSEARTVEPVLDRFRLREGHMSVMDFRLDCGSGSGCQHGSDRGGGLDRWSAWALGSPRCDLGLRDILDLWVLGHYFGSCSFSLGLLALDRARLFCGTGLGSLL
ncbi:hypothetical protein PS1_019976 [Malus domestica]